MKAVEMLENVEKYFERNHGLLLRFGGLAVLIFFLFYVPYNMIQKTQDKLLYQLEHERATNLILTTKIEDINSNIEFLELPYDRKQAVLREVECLAKNIYFEASGEPHKGKLAVAQVTMNRVRDSYYPRSVCGVVYQRTKATCQFSWVCEGKTTPRDKKAWDESVKIAESILINKKDYNVVGQAKHFHAVYVDPTWADTKRVVSKIGNHVFYH
jgi:spore germination cell wall hydrolase CwlJ-like protein